MVEKDKDKLLEVLQVPKSFTLTTRLDYYRLGNALEVNMAVRSMFSSATRLLYFQLAHVQISAHAEKVWVKLYGVPVTAFSEDRLSAIATKLGTPLMFDSYTSDMCMQSWGRSSYARVMIKLRADVELKDNITMAMPKITREGHYTCNVRVEQAILVDKDGNPLKKVEFSGEYDSEDEVALVGFGTQSLLEQGRDSYGNGDYDDDPYDDDMYEGQDLSHELQAIYDNLDIRV
ncbi:putative reverse transcriptase domain-containing protein [Tanacetum coccineum]